MYYIGVDLGGTNIAAGLVNESGEIVLKKSVPTLSERGYEPIMKDIGNLCIDIISEFGIKQSEVKSIGVGSPGTIDPLLGTIIYANNLKFNDVPMRTEIQKYINLPIYLENDANCAALGENFSGAAKGAKNSVMITLGTGVGGGIIINNEIYSGSYFGGAELGHMVIKSGGEYCTCGRLGCWEAYSSATAIIRDAGNAAIKNPNSILSQLVNGDVSLIDAKTPFDAAQKGDQIAIEVIENYITYLAEGIANVYNIFQPEIIVIGGGVCYQGDNLLLPLIEKTTQRVYANVLKSKIVIATLGNDAGIVGAAVLGK